MSAIGLECRDGNHAACDGCECPCHPDAAWDAYVESTRVRICLPCQAGDHRGCDPEFCDCAHFDLTANTPTKEGTPA